MINRRPLLAGAAASGMLAARPTAHAAPSRAEPLTVVLDWLLNANHASLFAALQTGAFARAGLDVTILSPSDPDVPCRQVAANQADLAVSYGSQINVIDAAGLPLVRVATLVDTPLDTIMALGGSGVRTLADLKGRKVGLSISGVEHALLAAMLQSAGLTASDITVVNVSYNMVTALILHQIDAAIGAYRNGEVLQVQQMGLEPVVFLPEDHGVPPYDELILVARRDRGADPRLHRFVAALREGTAALAARPDELWKSFASAHPDLDTPLTRASWAATLPYLPASPGHLDAARYLDFQRFALAHGIVSRAEALGQFAVQLEG